MMMHTKTSIIKVILKINNKLKMMINNSRYKLNTKLGRDRKRKGRKKRKKRENKKRKGDNNRK